MSGSQRPRDPILAVCAAMRQAIDRANAANLSVKKHRTVLACLSLTAGRSRFADEVYVEDVRRLTGPTEEEWLDPTTVRRHLIEFGERGIFGWATRRGTDAEGCGFPSTLTLPKVGQTGRYERPVSSAASEGGQTGRTPDTREEQAPHGGVDRRLEAYVDPAREASSNGAKGGETLAATEAAIARLREIREAVEAPSAIEHLRLPGLTSAPGAYSEPES